MMAASRVSPPELAAHEALPRVLVACLPISGTENPYQSLMMDGLRENGTLRVEHGAAGRVLAALRTCIRQRPDFLHYDWNYSYFVTRSTVITALLGMMLLAELWIVRRLFNCRIVWTFHNIESHEKPHPRLERWVQQQFARQCAWIRIMYRSSLDRTMQYLGVAAEMIRVVPMGPYFDCYPNDVSMSDARRALGFDPEHRVLLNIGAMRRYKGILKLLSALHEIEDPRLRLIIAGPCNVACLAEEVRRAAELDRRVLLMMEFVPNDRLQLVLNAANAVILPFQRVENSSSVLLAMSFAKPVIAPAQGVLPEQLVQQRDLLYEEGGLHRAVVGFLSADTKELENAGRRNQAAVRECRWSDFAKVFCDPLEVCAARQPDAPVRHFPSGHIPRTTGQRG